MMVNIARTLLRPVLAVVLALGGASGADAQEYKWNMPTPYAEGSFHTKNTRMFAEDVKKLTNGRMAITVHSNGSLFKLPEINRAVQTGQVPIGETNLPAYGNESPFYEIDVVMLLVKSYDDALRLWQLSRPYVEKRLDEQGIMPLYVVPFPGMGMISKGPVEKLSDLKGTKFRAWGPAAVRFAEQVGANPTVVQASELAQAFQVGIVENTLTSASTGVATQAWDYAGYFIDLNCAHSKDTIIVNKAIFEGLPKDIQDAILEAAETAEKRGWEWSKAENDETKATLAKNGMQVVTPTPRFMDELKKVGDALAAEWEKRAGPDGTALLQAYRQ